MRRTIHVKTVIGVIAVLLAVALVVVGIVMANRKKTLRTRIHLRLRSRTERSQPSRMYRTDPIHRQNRPSPNCPHRQTPKTRTVRRNPKESRM